LHLTQSSASAKASSASSRLLDRLARSSTHRFAEALNNLPPSDRDDDDDADAINHDLPIDFPDRDATALYHHLSNGGAATPTKTHAALEAVQATPSLAAARANPGHVKARAAELATSLATHQGPPRELFKERAFRALPAAAADPPPPPPPPAASPPPPSASAFDTKINCSREGTSSLFATRQASQVEPRPIFRFVARTLLFSAVCHSMLLVSFFTYLLLLSTPL